MAHLTNLKIRTPNGTRNITVHVNSSRIGITYTSWTQTTDIKYKLLFDDEFFYPNTNTTLGVYKDDVYQQTATITCTSGSSMSWTGTGSYEGISISVNATAWQSYPDFYEEFTLYREDTLGENDFTNVYRCDLIHSGGTTTVYHEQIPTPTFVSCDDTETDELVWVFENEDADIAVDMWARLGTASFTEKASNVAAGGNGTLTFTGLSANTSYNVDVYCKPATTNLKIDSAEATDTQTTATVGVKTWVYQGTTGSYYRSISYYGNNSVCKFANITIANTQAALESAYPAASEPLNRTGRTVNYNNAFPATLCSYHYYKVEYV